MSLFTGSYGSTSQGQYKNSKGADSEEQNEVVAIKSLQGKRKKGSDKLKVKIGVYSLACKVNCHTRPTSTYCSLARLVQSIASSTTWGAYDRTAILMPFDSHSQLI